MRRQRLYENLKNASDLKKMQKNNLSAIKPEGPLNA